MKIKTEKVHTKIGQKNQFKKKAEPLEGSNIELADVSNCHTLLLKMNR